MNIKVLFFSSLPSECIHHFWPRLSDQFKDLHLLQVRGLRPIGFGNNNYYETLKTIKITEIRTVHTHF